MSEAKPIRVQRQRTKGWRMPENTVSVTRPGLYGNPYRIGDRHPATGKLIVNADQAVVLFREHIARNTACNPGGSDSSVLEFCKQQLRGKNLACFCPLDQPCHADVWLEVANA